MKKYEIAAFSFSQLEKLEKHQAVLCLMMSVIHKTAFHPPTHFFFD